MQVRNIIHAEHSIYRLTDQVYRTLRQTLMFKKMLYQLSYNLNSLKIIGRFLLAVTVMEATKGTCVSCCTQDSSPSIHVHVV